MKLSNHLTIRLTAMFIIIFLIWSMIYFFMQMHEIYHDIDEGLTNLKQEFIVQADDDVEFVENMIRYNPINMRVHEITYEEAILVREEHSTTKVYFETEKEFEEVRILTTAFRCEANSKYYSLQIFTSTVETGDLAENMFVLLVLLWITIGTLLFFVSRSVIERSNKPFYKLLDRLNAFSLDNTKMIDLPETNISEYKALNSAIYSLLKENIQAYTEQKVFIENASHELQTPLTVIIAKVELMMNSPHILEEQLSELSTVLTHLDRMKRLNSSLLLLSKIRNKQFVASRDIDIQSVVEGIYDTFEDIIEHKGLRYECRVEAPLLVKMNDDLAHIMISNLVKNAVNYNLPNGRIIITLGHDSMTIANDGNSIPDNINIFERYTSSESTVSSSGLGLAIVSSVASVYDFKLKYTYTDMHQIVVVFR